MRTDYIAFINTLHNSMGEYTVRETEKPSNKNKTPFKSVYYSLLSVMDMLLLCYRLPKIKNKKTTILYIHTSFIKYVTIKTSEKFYDNIKPKENYIYISYDKYFHIKNIGGVKVYNIGIFVKLLSKLKLYKKLTWQNEFNIWYPVQNFLCKKLASNVIYIPVYSNGAGLSLVFNKYRNNYKLIEVQHGSVINYPPYSFVSNIALVNTFYYRTEEDKHFLKQKLFAKQDVELLQINKQQISFLPETNRIEILYINSFEFNEFHPVFKQFINNLPTNVFIKVRLHPRQLFLEESFSKQLEDKNVNFEIHKYSNWYENLASNTCIISPISSVIEEAVHLGLKVIIIDDLGAKRFKYLLNKENCIFTNNLFDSYPKK